MASTTDSRADDEDQVRVADGDDYGFFTDTSDSDGDDARSYLSHDASTADLSRNSSSTDVAREFAGGVVVGCSVSVRRCVDGGGVGSGQHAEYQLLVSRGGDCHVRWVRHTDLAAHHDATAAGAAYARARCAWLDGERRRRSRRSVGDFAYLAARRRAYLAWLQELLFAAPAPGAVERLAFPTELALRRGVESHTALDPPKRDEGRASPLAAYVA
ncbi:hypothetical protein JL721_7733 [Aureococcus anophagefferens]|nr:hypothetical protein JL721_7733 [Aureococcus anophagefferens]